MEKKLAIIAIMVYDYDATESVNALLHDFRDEIVGRMGIPVKEKNTSVISVVVNSAPETINSLSGKLGMIEGVSSKVLMAK